MPSMMTTPKLIIFSDLDGTLLDRTTYSSEGAEPALRLLKESGIPLVLASSKTRPEVEVQRRKVGLDSPFIVENGGAVFVPREYFSFSFSWDREGGDYFVLELGSPYAAIVEALRVIRKETGIRIKGFSDLSEEEVSRLCGLSPREAGFAKAREFDEPFLVEGGEEEIETVRHLIEAKGFNYAWGGRFHHILGRNDKGKAVEILKELYEREFSPIRSIAVGDDRNDIPMLRAVDYPILLRERGDSSLDLPVQNLIRFDGTGPKAWNDAVLGLLKKLKIVSRDGTGRSERA
jgi:mannosyl-3-phosphoglycerate phosphatase